MSPEHQGLASPRGRVDNSYISKPARYITAAIAVATLGLEVWAYLAYRDSVDGQAVLVNFAILAYAFIVAGVVFGIDEVVRHLSRRRRAV